MPKQQCWKWKRGQLFFSFVFFKHMEFASISLRQDDFDFCKAFLHLCVFFLKCILKHKVVKM